ncbi:hypothetical protein K474DRAFT_1605557 [Panus rudis PR-1116 ss-1]|nr:hypothetical protein K474DRAFT_1605557 [Panus rudis PR-1116 ss-1]
MLLTVPGIIASALLYSLVTALPQGAGRFNHIVHEKRALDPSETDWIVSHKPHPSTLLPLRIGLTQSNLDRLEELLLSVSHPESPSYGKHFSPAEIVETFKPSDEAIDSVMGWLSESGLARERMRLSVSKGWVEVINSTVGEVEDLLKTEYHVYTHPSGVQQMSCHEYSVPEHIREHVDLIKPTVHFTYRIPTDPPLSAFKRSNDKRNLNRIGMPSASTGPKTNGKKVTITPSLENCDEMITPDCLRALYSVNYKPVATRKNTYGIVEFTPQSFLAKDLDLFFANFSPSQVGTRPKLVSIDGGVVQTQNQSFDFNGESDLDLEYAFALTNPQPITLLQTGDLPEGASFNNWLDAVDKSFCTFEGGDDPTQDGIYPDPLPGGFKGPESCGIIAPPNVVSVSYGSDESSVTAAYAQRQCAEYAKLGMMGTTVLYSSGDDGVAGNGGVCLNAQGRPSRNGTKFNPDFPVTCGLLTAVGATQVNPGSTVNDPESACQQVIFSGGGFSNIFKMPNFQKNAVTNFLKNHPPPFTSAQFNNSGNARGFPDLSANGANYVIGINGEFGLVFGTSASSPVVGSLITLINDARIAAGKGPVGFINPAIYSEKFAHAFNDITTGTNPGCGESFIQLIL